VLLCPAVELAGASSLGGWEHRAADGVVGGGGGRPPHVKLEMEMDSPAQASTLAVEKVQWPPGSCFGSAARDCLCAICTWPPADNRCPGSGFWYV
jgi:hypothetical protein